jgi:hypothetical protein
MVVMRRSRALRIGSRILGGCRMVMTGAVVRATGRSRLSITRTQHVAHCCERRSSSKHRY